MSEQKTIPSKKWLPWTMGSFVLIAVAVGAYHFVNAQVNEKMAQQLQRIAKTYDLEIQLSHGDGFFGQHQHRVSVKFLEWPVRGQFLVWNGQTSLLPNPKVSFEMDINEGLAKEFPEIGITGLRDHLEITPSIFNQTVSLDWRWDPLVFDDPMGLFLGEPLRYEMAGFHTKIVYKEDAQYLFEIKGLSVYQGNALNIDLGQLTWTEEKNDEGASVSQLHLSNWYVANLINSKKVDIEKKLTFESESKTYREDIGLQIENSEWLGGDIRAEKIELGAQVNNITESMYEVAESMLPMMASGPQFWIAVINVLDGEFFKGLQAHVTDFKLKNEDEYLRLKGGLDYQMNDKRVPTQKAYLKIEATPSIQKISLKMDHLLKRCVEKGLCKKSTLIEADLVMDHNGVLVKKGSIQ